MRWENTVLIDAPASGVWDLTIDVATWPSFTPTMQRVERLDAGPMRIGSSARIKQPGQTPAVWTVTRVEPERELTWQTRRMGLTMVGSHTLTTVGTQCRNTLSIDVAGRGSRLFALVIGWLVRRSLAVENAGFKAQAERSS
jgi:Polyketide cyclase / dehydrase and lipid transport